MVDEHSPFAPDSAVDEAENVKPHRGGLVLSIGILSWLTQCVVFGVVAWVLGLHDLPEMSQSRRDAGGRTATRIGMIFGAIHCMVLIVVVGLAVILWMLPSLAR